MPMGKKDRPSTASGRIETVPSFLSELQHPEERRESHLGPGSLGLSIGPEQPLEWIQRELLKQNQRRHSLHLGEWALGRAALCHYAHSNDTSLSLENSQFINCLIDQKVSLESLQKLKLAFEEYEKDGLRALDERRFGLIMKKCLGLHNTSNSQIQDLFMKIDYMSQGKIAWDEFCTYMQLEYSKREESALRKKQAAFSLPAKVRPFTHGEPVLRVHSVSDSAVVTLREDGSVQLWSPELLLQRTKASLFHERAANRKQKYATDLTPMTQYNKLIVATGDREIRLYELSTLEAYCQISGLETLPLMLDYCYTGTDECSIVYGDCQGCVNIILMSSVGETLRLWKNLPKTENVPSIGLEQATMSSNVTFIRWKVHRDWVTQVKYFPNFSAVVSSSNDEASSVVIGCVKPSTNVQQKMKEITEGEGKAKKVQLNWAPQPRQACDQAVFSAYKGVKTFDLCKKHKLLVTGGLDRLVRLWNPYVPGKPTGILKGHSAPIFYLCISSEDGQIFSVSMDTTVKIWDIQEQCCVFTAECSDSLIHGDLSACLYSPFMKSLFMAADHMTLLSLKTRRRIPRYVVASHSEPVLCCGYSEELRQVVSCSEGSVIKVWNLENGRQVFEYGEAHGTSAVTCMTFDPQGRRLITGGGDGCLKIWNFNNGQCLKILKREGECQKICDCAYLKIHRNVYVISAGWNRTIDIFPDCPEDPRQLTSPQPNWPDDLRSGHRDDILCVAQGPPGLLATGSYDGEILVWNTISGHIQCRLRSPAPAEQGHAQGGGPASSVLALMFLRGCAADAEPSCVKGLLSCGTAGVVCCWNVRNGGQLLCCFKASERQVTKLTQAGDGSELYAADQIGYIFVFNVRTLSQDHKAPRETFWRAHTSTVTGLQIVEDGQTLLTSSTDCTVRLWSVRGEFIGTFGQAESWNLRIKASWKHPAVPHEILVDPLSMPDHPFLRDDPSPAPAADPREEEQLKQPESHPPSISEKDAEKEMSISYPEQPGAHLRHAIFKHGNKSLSRGGVSVYHSLKCFDIQESPGVCVRPGPRPARPVPLMASTAEDSDSHGST